MIEQRIGFVGLGNMGTPMVENFLAAGLSVEVFDIDPSRITPLVNKGAVRASNAAQVSSKVDVLFSSLPTAQSVVEMVTGELGLVEGAKSGLIYVDTSTVPPPLCGYLANELAQHGIEMLDAPVSGGKAGAQAGTLSIMVGGSLPTYNKCRPLFEVIGSVVGHFGEKVGSGMHAKMANQIMVGIHLAALSEAMAYGAKAGLQLDTLVELLRSGRADSEILGVNGPRILAGDIEEIGAMGPMTLLHKDLHCIVESMCEMGIRDSLSKKVHAMYHKLISQDQSAGTPIRDGMGLIYLYEEMFDVNVVDIS
jgi:2-hydroxy-3-oxopropionate reductase